jgi:hypothetical protein
MPKNQNLQFGDLLSLNVRSLWGWWPMMFLLGNSLRKFWFWCHLLTNFFKFRSLWQYFMIVENNIFSSWEIQGRNSKNKRSFGGFQLPVFKENKSLDINIRLVCSQKYSRMFKWFKLHRPFLTKIWQSRLMAKSPLWAHHKIEGEKCYSLVPKRLITFS